MTLHLLRFNNYINRIVKKFDTIEEYPEPLYTFENYNFNPNDDVSTEIIVGQGEILEIPDYCIITEPGINSSTGLTEKIISRWFVIESNRTRGGQYKMMLYRDTIVDYYDTIIDSPCFIEKGTLPNDSPLIFNSENMTFNQIKKSEVLLKDKSECAWLVGYYAKNATDFNGTVPVNSNVEAEIINYPKLEDWPLYQDLTTGVKSEPLSGYYTFKVHMGIPMGKPLPTYYRIQVNYKNGNTLISQTKGPAELKRLGYFEYKDDFKNAFVNFGLNNLNPLAYITTETDTKINSILFYDGKTIRTNDGKYYKIQINSKQEDFTANIPSGALYNDLNTILKKNMGFNGDTTDKSYEFKYTSNVYTIEATEQVNLETTYNLDGDKTITTDAPWNIFAIPYGVLTINGGSGIECITNAEIAISIAMAIQQQQQSKVHDIQLLPYCPIQSLTTYGTEIYLNDFDKKDYSLIKNQQNDKTVGIIFNVPKSNFTFKLYDDKYKISISESSINKKLNHECDKWRLSSPNYSNYFDFSAEMNNGVEYFDVDCNYKPFTPYIHINPNFNGLYGSDFNDVRGLICGGDFSLSSIIDQWKQYEIQNKNYQLTFDRQIQNMTVLNKYQRTQDIATAISGTATGAVSGAFAGSMVGGGVGAAVGAMVGGVGSAIGGITDVNLKEKIRNETLDYTKDLFGYQLGNIQALPQTISKVSAFNSNNKIFPILEYYTCTDIEKEALANKLAYNGMSIGVIGKISDYIENSWEYNEITSKGYIKGKIIRIENLTDEYHLANTIVNEINQGVFI